jgi:hypothetical protein
MSTKTGNGSTPTVGIPQVFASGSTTTFAPDSITIGGGSIWVEYGNGADSTGIMGTSTIVQYNMTGGVVQTYAGGAPLLVTVQLVWPTA